MNFDSSDISSDDPSDTASLRDFGFSSDHADSFSDLTSHRPGLALQPARVVFESNEYYRLMTSSGEVKARLAGRLRQGGTFPVVGDWVAVPASQEHLLLVQEILPRKTRLSRKVPGEKTQEQVVAANVDTVFVVMGLDGDYNLRRLERFLVMVQASGAQPVVVLTKADLHQDPIGARLDAQAVAPGVAVWAVSSTQGEGLEPIRSQLAPGLTVALIGSSGAGKSTLLNRLCNAEVMLTGAVRDGDDRGRHTTTHRQLVRLPGGGLLIDNPGIREVQLWGEGEDLAETFDDLEALASACRFRDCQHRDEPGCEVLAAIDQGLLKEARLVSWRTLQKELRHLERRRDVAASRQEDRRLGRFYKRVQAQKKARRP
ncbi:MAG: ribosome small subunit-dependent GTPase A [Deltaproteobacteria bacterium]|nr:ribosome small subunit-dependent GTPase A [Deltaproteobacteria bacterium]